MLLPLELLFARRKIKKSSDYNDTIPFRILDLYDQGVRKNRSMINLKKGGDVKTEVKRRTKEKGKYQFVKSFDEMYKKQIKWKAVLKMWLGGLLGAGAGFFCAKLITTAWLSKIFAVVLIVFGLYQLFLKEKPQKENS